MSTIGKFRIGEWVRRQGRDEQFVLLLVHEEQHLADLLNLSGRKRIEAGVPLEAIYREEEPPETES